MKGFGMGVEVLDWGARRVDREGQALGESRLSTPLHPVVEGGWKHKSRCLLSRKRISRRKWVLSPRERLESER